MGTSVILALLVCLHVVAGASPAKGQARSCSCPTDPDMPVEVLAEQVKSHEETVCVMGCDTVSVDKGEELAKKK